MSVRAECSWIALFVMLGAAACSGAPTDADSTSDQNLESDRHSSKDAGAKDSGSAKDSGGTADGGGGDGTPTRKPCTSQFGKALTGSYGRLDGYLVAVVAPGHGACNADSDHVHLQVLSGGSVYDVAVNADSGFYKTLDAKLPGEAWSEGWHSSEKLDYVSNLGLHSTEFTSASKSTVATLIESSLAEANHVSIFATTYNDSGIHDVHRESPGRDGAIVFDPLSPTAHLLTFHFSDQSF